MENVPWSTSDGREDGGGGGDGGFAAYSSEALVVLPIRVVGIVAVERADFSSAGAVANHLLDKDVFPVRYFVHRRLSRAGRWMLADPITPRARGRTYAVPATDWECSGLR